MKKKIETKKNLSHNVYYDKDNYRIRLYRNDHKIFEKQMKMTKLHYMNFSKELIFILHEFEKNLLEIERQEDTRLSILDFANAMNKIFWFENQMENKNERENS